MTSIGYDAAHAEATRVATVLDRLARLIDPPGATGEARESLDLGMREEARSLRTRARELEAGVFQILVIGEFKNGKSTLLNALLGSKRLPTKATPSTAVITVLVHGESPDVAIHESGCPQPRTVSWEEFVREFQLSREDQETLEGHRTLDRFRDVEYAQIEVDHPLTASGVTLVDSPGLGEHITRTRVATGFLRRAHAVILVLNATRLLTQDERDFIDRQLGTGRLPHVFFVVNRIDQIEAVDVPLIEGWVRDALAPHFQAGYPSGVLQGRGAEAGARVFDEDLFARRVFFTDARGALAAAGEGDEAQREAMGIARLERELERFLATEERVDALLESTRQVVAPVVAQAERRIVQRGQALDRPLRELEALHAEAERELSALEARKEDIERTVLLFGETIAHRVYSSLLAYIEEMHAGWKEDSRRLMDLDRAISLKGILSAYTQQEARERIAVLLEEEVQRYLRIKFGAWSDRIPAAIQADIGAMMEEVEAQVDELTVELDRIANAFAGVTADPGGRTAGTAALQQLPLSVADISSMASEILDLGDWQQVLGRMAQQAVAVVLVSTFLTGGNFLVALVLVEAVNFGLHEGEIKKRIRETLGERLHERLREQIGERRAFIDDAVMAQFRQFATAVTAAVSRQINETRAEQVRVLEQKASEHFSVQQEQERLAAMAEELRQVAEQLDASSP